jgi:hypothetical protein
MDPLYPDILANDMGEEGAERLLTPEAVDEFFAELRKVRDVYQEDRKWTQAVGIASIIREARVEIDETGNWVCINLTHTMWSVIDEELGGIEFPWRNEEESE